MGAARGAPWIFFPSVAWLQDLLQELSAENSLRGPGVVDADRNKPMQTYKSVSLQVTERPKQVIGHAGTEG